MALKLKIIFGMAEIFKNVCNIKNKIMKIEVHLLSQSKAILYENVKNAYTKDGMYCIYKEDGFVDKYPLVNIFRVRESY
jgi:hypothetical protein